MALDDPLVVYNLEGVPNEIESGYRVTKSSQTGKTETGSDMSKNTVEVSTLPGQIVRQFDNQNAPQIFRLIQ